METFKGAEVAPINELLERTHYVQALRAEIERLTNAGLEAAYGEATKADELEYWIATCDRLTADNAELRSRVSDLEQDLRLAEDDHDADIDDLAGKLAAAHQELHDLRIRAGLGECDLFKHEWKETYYGYKCAKCDLFVPFGCEPWAPDEPVIINCPQCGAEHVDMDGFGVIYCEACKYCVHPQTDGGVCGICGQEAN